MCVQNVVRACQVGRQEAKAERGARWLLAAEVGGLAALLTAPRPAVRKHALSQSDGVHSVRGW